MRAAPQPQADWAAELSELLPAIEACLQDSGVAAIGVTKAWPIDVRRHLDELLHEGGAAEPRA